MNLITIESYLFRLRNDEARLKIKKETTLEKTSDIETIALCTDGVVHYNKITREYILQQTTTGTTHRVIWPPALQLVKEPEKNNTP